MKKLKQIVSCSGWVARMEDDEVVGFLPIACWGLTDSSEVVPIVSLEGRMVDATTLEDFVEAVSEEVMFGELDDDEDG